MFSKALFASLFVGSLVLQSHAHAIVAPPLGVTGTPARSDVQKPSTAEPCGNIPVSDIDTSTAVPADAQGNVDLTATDFNAGADGSRQVTAKVNADGTGKSFVAATVSKNGNPAPTTVGSDPITVQLPAGTKCTGGTAGNLCLMSFVTTAGFGNCVVVSQGAASAGGAAAAGAAAAAGGAAAAAATGSAAAAASAAPAAAATSAAAATATAQAAGSGAAKATAAKGKAAKGKAAKGKGKGKGKAAKAKKQAAQPAGARAARSILAEGREITKRSGPFSWIWA